MALPPGEFTDAEITQLANQQITSLTALWERIGKDFDHGLDEVAGATGIDVARLRGVLAHKAKRDFDLVGESLGKPQAVWRTRTTHALERHWLEIAGAALILLTLFLILRAAGLMGRLPAPFGLRERVVVAARDLDAGAVIRQGDLFTSRMSSHEDYFHELTELNGLILAQAVHKQRPLRYSDVRRLQVVAKSDIPGGKTITAEDVQLDWTPYQRGAFEHEEEVKNQVARKAIRKGDVVLSDFVEAAGKVAAAN